MLYLASFPVLPTPAFVLQDKSWGGKDWERGYAVPIFLLHDQPMKRLMYDYSSVAGAPPVLLEVPDEEVLPSEEGERSAPTMAYESEIVSI